MDLCVCEMGEIPSRRCFAKHMLCIQMDGDGNIWDNPKVFAYLPHCMLVYLHEFVGFTAFFPSNKMLSFLCFFLPLVLTESLLLASWTLADSLGVDFLGVNFLGVDFKGADFLEAAGVPLFFRILQDDFLVPLPLTFFALVLPKTALS